MAAGRAIFLNGQRVGSVAKFAGEPPATQWWAWSRGECEPSFGNCKGFRTRKDAIAWIYRQAGEDDPGSGHREG